MGTTNRQRATVFNPTWRNQPAYRLLLFAGLALLLVWIGWKTVRITQLALSLHSHQQAAQALTADGLMSVDPDAAEALVMNLRRDVVGLKAEVQPLLPVAPLFAWLPRVGPLFASAEPLLEMADAGSEAAAYSLRSLKPALVLLQSSENSGEELLAGLLPILEAAEPDLNRATLAMDRFVAARAEIEDIEVFPWQVRALMEKIDGKLYLAEQLHLLPVLPQLLGQDGPRTYLIIAQNEDEIRATGGFITGAGLLKVDNGRIVQMTFQDANRVDDWQNKPYDFPPQPLYDLMGLELFVFRDSNFWPDFPTSAEQAMALYSYGQDVGPLDGAIAIDQQFVSMLLAVTGPVTIPDLDTTVSSQSVVESLREAWSKDEDESVGEWTPNRKDFLGPFAQALRTRLFSNLGDIDFLYLAETMHRAAEDKHLQIYIKDPDVAPVLNRLDWDGRLEQPTKADLLMVVDTNVGFNKVNPLLSSDISYHVTLNDDGTGLANLGLRYEHTGSTSTADDCIQEVLYDMGPSYQDLIDRCFWNYLRIYVPQQSTLLESTNHGVPRETFSYGQGWQGGAQVVEESGQRRVFANFFLLPRGQSLVSNYTYQLPQVVVEDDGIRHYRLHYYKQAGQNRRTVEISVTIPPGSRVIDTAPAAVIDNQTVTFAASSFSDQTFTVQFR